MTTLEFEDTQMERSHVLQNMLLHHVLIAFNGKYCLSLNQMHIMVAATADIELFDIYIDKRPSQRPQMI